MWNIIFIFVAALPRFQCTVQLCTEACNKNWGYDPDAAFEASSERPVEFLGAVVCGQQCVVEDNMLAEERSHFAVTHGLTKNIELFQTREGELTKELEELAALISGSQDEVKAFGIKKAQLEGELMKTHQFTGNQEEDCNSEKDRLGQTISQLNTTITALEGALVSLQAASETDYDSRPGEINGVAQGRVASYQGREGVLRIFQKVKDDMEGQRRTASEDLHSWKHTCDISMLSLDNSVSQLESQISIATEKLSNANATLNGALGTQKTSQAELENVRGQLHNKTSELSQTRNMYDNYMDTAKSEVAALVEAQRMLKEFRRTTEGASMEEARNLTSLIEIRKHFRSSSPAERAASLLVAAASKSSKVLGSNEKTVIELSKAAQSIYGRPGSENRPDKVRGQSFIERVLQMFIHLKDHINDEMASEISHFQWCETEIKKTKMHLSKSTSRHKEADSRLRAAQAKIDELGTSITELTDENSGIQQTMEEARKVRLEDRTRYERMLEEMERKKRSFDKCVAYLHEFYASHPHGTPVFLNSGEVVDQVSAKMVATLNEMKNDETQAVALYDQGRQENEAQLKTNAALLSQKQQQLGFQQNDERTFNKQTELHLQSLDNLETYKGQLAKPCFSFDNVARKTAFDERQAGFTNELLAIDQAAEILKNAYASPEE